MDTLITVGVAAGASAATSLLILLTQHHIQIRRERRMWRRMERYANYGRGWHPSYGDDFGGTR